MPTKRREPLTDDEMVLRGAAILKRYQHPDDWERGSSTGKAHLLNTMTLKVEELRIGNPAPGMAANDADQARDDAHAIAAFARWLRIKIQIDQQPGKAPRIYVRDTDWQDALAVLKAL
jgi:hypothetical protein